MEGGGALERGTMEERTKSSIFPPQCKRNKIKTGSFSLAVREDTKLKNNSIPEQNGRLIMLGDREIKGRASLPTRRVVFSSFFFVWQQLAGKVAGKAKERKKEKRERIGVWWGGGLFLAACLRKWLTCCGIMRRLSVEPAGEQPRLIEGG